MVRFFYRGRCVGEIDQSAARTLLDKELAFAYKRGILFLSVRAPQKELNRLSVAAKK
jgi:hypothetical protein